MSMPAVEGFRLLNPGVRITVLVKTKLEHLWRLHAAVDQVISYRSSMRGTESAAARLRGCGFDRAVIFPNSFRSAWIPFRAGIVDRAGVPRRGRGFLLTDRICLTQHTGRHQSWEYFDLLGMTVGGDRPAAPTLAISGEMRERVLKGYGLDARASYVGVMPGAARGPSKRWSAENFGHVARALAGRYRVLVLGSPGELETCRVVAHAAGSGSVNLAGQTSVETLAVLLGLCRTVVCNDSGGMHLAAAMRTPVVAIFGLTDPAKTGPLGDGHRVIAPEGVEGSRRIRRQSRAATSALQRISPERVLGALEGILAR